MSRDFIAALLQLNAEKGVPREHLIRTVEDAIQSAYRRFSGDEDVHVRIDPESGRIRVFRARRVVAEIEDETIEMTLADGRLIQPDAQVGDLIETEELDPEHFGRIHAQTAKQVVLQRLREAERDVVFEQYASREGELITGTVNRVEPRGIILDVGRAEAVLAVTEQSATEHYRIGQNVKAYVLEVRRTTKGPQVLVSRTHKGFLRRLFELEVPEIHNGTVEIKAIAREAGSRSKVAVASRQEGLDPVGATVGQRGARVQAVVAELGGEKIDVIPWNEDPGLFVANALSPAQVVDVQIDEEHRIASVTVPERMLSLAIGREGQNARLAAKLSGWRIDIRSDVPRPEVVPQPEAVPADPAPADPVSAPVSEPSAVDQPVAAGPAPLVEGAAGASVEETLRTDEVTGIRPAEAPAAAPEAPARRKAPAAAPEAPARRKAPAAAPEAPARRKAPAAAPEAPAKPKATRARRAKPTEEVSS